MTRKVEAVYEHGVLRPLEPLTLGESQRVKLTISDASTGSLCDLELIERAKAEVAAMNHVPSIEEVGMAFNTVTMTCSCSLKFSGCSGRSTPFS